MYLIKTSLLQQEAQNVRINVTLKNYGKKKKMILDHIHNERYVYSVYTNLYYKTSYKSY